MDTIEFLSEKTGIHSAHVVELLHLDGEASPREGSFGEGFGPRLPVVSLSPYDDFLSRRVSHPCGIGGCSRVRDVLQPLLAVVDEWRSLNPADSVRPRCERCKRVGRGPRCLKCEGLR